MRTDYLDATTGDIQLKLDSRAHDGFPGVQCQISMMPNIVADQQTDDTGCQRASNIPVNAAKIDGIVQFSADLFKSLPFPFQSVLGLIPFGSGGLQRLEERRGGE